jgi:acetyl esterase/lipase
MRKWILTGVSLVLVTTTATAQQRAGRLPENCRAEFMQNCKDAGDRAAMRTCLAQNRDHLSAPCRGALRDRIAKRADQTNKRSDKSIRAQGGVEISYGNDKLQKLDYFAAKEKGAPLVVFVHGGGWKNGDKDNATGKEKAPHYLGQGYAFASINYRLLPSAPVEQQAADVASAIAYLRKNAAQLGFDGQRIVLMGHSAGAHLVALVGTDPQYLRAVGFDQSVLAGIVPIDGAAYDVAKQLTDGPKMMQDTYHDAFGDDPARQRALSPSYHTASPNAPSFLIVHVQREDGIAQSQTLAAALRQNGTQVQINAFEGRGLKGHMEINRKLGDPTYPATPVVDNWLQRVFGR